MKTLKRQRGLSSLGWLFVISVAGFALLCGFKLGPVYLDNNFVRGALQSLAKEGEIGSMSNGEIRSKLSKLFTINNIRGEVTKKVKIERKKDRVLVNINYEERIPLIYNIDVVLTFENQLDSSRPGECCNPPKDF
jgi:hypothetical protein